jgi:hypothetical protein
LREHPNVDDEYTEEMTGQVVIERWWVGPAGGQLRGRGRGRVRVQVPGFRQALDEDLEKVELGMDGVERGIDKGACSGVLEGGQCLVVRRQLTLDRVSSELARAWTTSGSLILEIWSRLSTVVLTPSSISIIASLMPELHGS